MPRNGLAHRSKVRLGLLLVLMAMQIGCVVTRVEGNQFKADIARLKSELATMQRGKSDQGIRTEQRILYLEKELVGARSEDARASIADEDIIQRELQTLRGELELLQKVVGDLKGELAENTRLLVAGNGKMKSSRRGIRAEGHVKLTPPKGKQKHLVWAKKIFDKGEYSKAVDAYSLYITKYRNDKKSLDKAHFYRGECFFKLAKKAIGDAEQKSNYKKAIRSYQKLLTEHKSSKKIDASLFKVGLSLEGMGLPSDARMFYEELMGEHPKSALVSHAKKRLASVNGKLKRARKAGGNK